MRFDINNKLIRVKAWFYAMFVEHNFINPFRYNFHKISDNVYRSSQPTMWQLKRDVKKYGIKTIINLKGANKNSAYYAFEVETCKKLGVTLVDRSIYSRAIPSADKIILAKETFESIEYPMWMHCKAGADRTGLYATLFQYFHDNTPIEQTNQLKFFPFGHLKQSKAGKVDFFFEKFMEYQKENPDKDLLYWVKNVMDREKLDKEFKSSIFSNLLNDYLFRRE
ncbi:MAG: hypothetical protein KN64_10080 [Sulfurovum sp. AS07-7]|jgi:protein tyrosine phosphatase (PTP) superfamily phosphohydrolase (DUF442 family)|nr:MAG: hypothetical protein KN64_10080 [Sulfurovum sp. AS07-7]